jgi:subfamily B ATP-binding cassette protein HlyB/CyaB
MDVSTEQHITPPGNGNGRTSKADDESQGACPSIDSGLNSLVMIARFHGVAADPAQIKHAFAIGSEGIQALDIVRAAKELGFKAKSVNVQFEKLSKLQLPAIAETRDGNFIIFAKAENDQVLALHPAETTPKIFKQEQLSEFWDGEGVK